MTARDPCVNLIKTSPAGGTHSIAILPDRLIPSHVPPARRSLPDKIIPWEEFSVSSRGVKECHAAGIEGRSRYSSRLAHNILSAEVAVDGGVK